MEFTRFCKIFSTTAEFLLLFIALRFFLKRTFLRFAKKLPNDVCGMNLKVKLIQIFILFVIGMLIDFATLLP